MENRVNYIETVLNKEIHDYYKLSDFFVNFNDKEIFGMSILEAMYQSCPVVAIHAPGPDFIIEDGISSILCSSISEMEEKISCEKDLLEFREKAHQRIVDNFTWEKTAQIIFENLKDKLGCGVSYGK